MRGFPILTLTTNFTVLKDLEVIIKNTKSDGIVFSFSNENKPTECVNMTFGTHPIRKKNMLSRVGRRGSIPAWDNMLQLFFTGIPGLVQA